MKNTKQKMNHIGLGMILIVCILTGCGAEQEEQKGSFEDSSKEVRQEDIVPMYCYEAAEQESEGQEDSPETMEEEAEEMLSGSGLLTRNSIADLGNHIVAYYIVDEAKGPNIVLQDLDTYSYLYIPKSGDIETVMNVALSDTGVELRYMDRHGEIHDTEFPVIFPFTRGDVIGYIGGIKKLNYTDAPFLPEVVWEDTIKQKDEYHKISLERVSQLYDSRETRYMADYRLAVKDMEGNSICSQKMTMEYTYEEVYWLLDISGDGYDDIVFCTGFEDSSKYANNTTLEVLIWDEGSGRFYKGADAFFDYFYHYVGAPQWNQEHSVIIYDTDGFNDYVYNTEMYVFRDGEWQLYADLAAHSELGNDILFFSDEAEEEKFYKGLDYYYIETVYKNGKKIFEQRLEDKEVQDKSAVWKIKNDENNLKLYPTEGWELTGFDSGDEGAVKWKKQKQEDAFEDSSKEVRQEDIAPMYCYEAEKQERGGQAYCYEAAEQESEEQEDASEAAAQGGQSFEESSKDEEQEDPSGTAEGEEEAPFASEPQAEGAVLDLGNHIVAYYIVDEWEGPNIVLKDLETYSYLYIPIESGYVKKILNVTLSDTDVELSYIRGGDGAICDMKLPVVFPFKRGDVIEIRDISFFLEKALRYVNAPPVPDVVWEDEIKQKDIYHKISLERISMLYAEGTERGGYAADYRLTVKDMEGNIICSQKVGMEYTYEEVYWLLDVSGDGYDDIVFCTYYDGMSKYHYNTTLEVLIWNEEAGRFDETEDLPADFYMGAPQWNQEHSAILYGVDGYNDFIFDTEMYVFRDGEWQLYADVVSHHETEDKIIYFPDYAAKDIFYKGLDYYNVESVYENGKAVFEQRLEDEELEDKSIVWKAEHDENNLQLYPEEGWECISFDFSSSEGTLKWIKSDEK